MKLLYLAKIFLEETDDEHRLTTPQIIDRLDEIQSSRFITEKKSDQLIRKIIKLTSRSKKSELQRQVYVSGRIRSMNESIYYSVDAIHNAINQYKKIGFRYFGWGVDKKPVLHRNGEEYSVSP